MWADLVEQPPELEHARMPAEEARSHRRRRRGHGRRRRRVERATERVGGKGGLVRRRYAAQLAIELAGRVDAAEHAWARKALSRSAVRPASASASSSRARPSSMRPAASAASPARTSARARVDGEPISPRSASSAAAAAASSASSATRTSASRASISRSRSPAARAPSSGLAEVPSGRRRIGVSPGDAPPHERTIDGDHCGRFGGFGAGAARTRRMPVRSDRRRPTPDRARPRPRGRAGPAGRTPSGRREAFDRCGIVVAEVGEHAEVL